MVKYLIVGAHHAYDNKEIPFVLVDVSGHWTERKVIGQCRAIARFGDDGWRYHILGDFKLPEGATFFVFEERADGDYTGASLLSMIVAK
jgi:hypothetical protein